MKMKFVVLSLLLAFAAIAQASEVQTTVGSGADTTLGNDSQSSGAWDANSTHGGDTGMKVRTAWTIRMKIGYMRFDITDNDQFDPVSGAILALYPDYSNRSRDLTVYGLADGLDGWNESTINYNNAPGIGHNPPDAQGTYTIDANLTPLTTMSLVQNDINRWYYSEPNSLMDSFINADSDGLVTFALIYVTTSTDTNPDWNFLTKEGSTTYAPRLIPEPATIALLGLGGLGLIRRRKR